MSYDPSIPPIPFTKEDLNSTIGERFLKVLQNLPEDHIAYQDSEITLTYKDLFKASQALASRLVKEIDQNGAWQQLPVALMIKPGWRELQCLLGTALAGQFYLMLDVDQSESQLINLLKDHPVKALITMTRLRDMAAGLVKSLPECRLIFLDELETEVVHFQVPALNTQTFHSVFFTSGSTGKPRGVIRVHGNGLHSSFYGANDNHMCPNDRITLTSSTAIGMSITSTLGALLNGSTIYRKLDALISPAAVYEWLKTDRITVFRSSAGLVRSLINLPEEATAPLPDLRCIDTGGESFTRQEVNRILALMPAGGELVVRLASNEVGNYAVFRTRMGDHWEGERNPAGYPTDTVTVFVVDENRKPLDPGEEGEIAVRSRYLAAGYLNDPQQTTARFAPDPDGGDERIYYTGDMGRITKDGLVEFLGRKDFRIKVRGYTIELEAVDAALKALPGTQDAVAAVQTLPSGNKRLVGYLVPKEGQDVSFKTIRQDLAKTLPFHMIPSVFLTIDALPSTPTDKVDRKALPLPPPTRPELDTPYCEAQSEHEMRFVDIWERLLGISPVGVNDSFFELGGDSLLSMQMILEVEMACGCKIPMEFFEHPTIANLCVVMQNQNDTAPALPVVTQPKRRSATPPKTKLARLLSLFGQPRAIWHSIILRVRKPFEKRILTMHYTDGIQWLLTWAQKPIVQTIFYQWEKRIFTEFMNSLGMDMEGHQEKFALTLAGNVWARISPKNTGPNGINYLKDPHRFWQELGESIENSRPDAENNLFEVQGFEHLEAAYERGQGVILLSYHGNLTKLPTALIMKWLGCTFMPVLSPRLTLRTDLRMVEKNLKAENILLQLNALQAQYGGNVMLRAYRTLTNGQIIRVYIDNGLTSRGDWPIAVCGKQYKSRTGWADLAYHTGATVIPMVNALQQDGSILLKIMPPLQISNPDQGYHQQIQELMEQYASFLSTAFRDFPNSLRWKIMKNHCYHPQATENA